jgi:two-component system sensor histidine kinase RpfC
MGAAVTPGSALPVPGRSLVASREGVAASSQPLAAQAAAQILERGGHAAALVNDGEQALDALEREAFDLVLLDRNMPGVSGIQALQALRLMTRGRERLPVVMLSADATMEAKREAFEAGADAFLAKPIEALRLLEEVQSLTAAKDKPARAADIPQAPRAAAPATGEAAVVNSETLGHLEELGSSAAFIEKLVTVFVSDSNALLERIEQSLAGRDYGHLRSLLHAMKGSSASIGTDRLTAVCGRLGKLSDAQLRLQSTAALRSLSDELAAARGELERHLQNRKRSSR